MEDSQLKCQLELELDLIQVKLMLGSTHTFSTNIGIQDAECTQSLYMWEDLRRK